MTMRAHDIGSRTFALTCALIGCTGSVQSTSQDAASRRDAAVVGEPGLGTGGAHSGGAATAGAGKDAGASGEATADPAWSELSVMAVVNPMEHGAAGNGTSDDLKALQATVNALPAAGGIVYFPRGKTFKKTNLLVITKSHVKLWSPNRQAEIFQSVNGTRRRQSILCRNNTGCGFFGLKLRSDAKERFDALEDNQISTDHGALVEVSGCEVQGSAATGIFLFGSSEHYIEGNYVHHTWADHIHHTDGASASWVWNNFIFNEEPSNGDDGVACVTYGPTSTRCGDMEWWRNTILHGGWGRGYSVIGGERIHIHDNWAIGAAGAGVIVASEKSYDTSNSEGIKISRNIAYGCGHSISHPGLLISGLNPAAGPLKDITLTGNVSVGAPAGPYRAEGAYMDVSNQEMATAQSAVPAAVPTQASVRYSDSSVLRTRDVSHVEHKYRTGLHRIHVREARSGKGFQQRFEYVVRGPEEALSAFTKASVAADAVLVEQRTVNGVAYALLLTPRPVAVPGELEDVTFRELRARDSAADLGWLWARIDAANY